MNLSRLAPLPKTRSTGGSRRSLVGRLLAVVPFGITAAVLQRSASARADGSGAIVGGHHHHHAHHHHQRDGNANKPKHHRRHNRGQQRCMHRCQAQVAPCQTVIVTACAGDGSNPDCATRLLPCCDPLATCDSGAAFQCIADNTK